MAKKSSVNRNERRKKTVEKYAAKRKHLKALVNDVSVPVADRDAAMRELQKLPRDASPSRVKNRCFLSGRSHAYYRKFGLSRIALRDLAHRGELPGVRKSSW
jgi:small subunit ribosomal protein S14